MSEPASEVERIDLSRAEDPRDVIHRAVACLAQGGLVGVPTDTADAVVGRLLSPRAVERMVAMLPRPAGEMPAAILARGGAEILDWVPDAGRTALRLGRRLWPGPLAIEVHGEVDRGLAARLPAEARGLVASERSILLRTSGHPVVREILKLVAGPLAIAPRVEPRAGSSAGLEMIIDDVPIDPGAAETLVRVEGEAWRLVRPGLISEADVARHAGTIILFVCTGNTCRSPMAEALCKAMLAKRLGCHPDQLEASGYVVISAGVAAMPGMPAAGHAAEVVARRGGSLAGHASRVATIELVRAADLVIAMTGDHLDVLLTRIPDAAPRSRLLDPHGDDLPDPIGSDLDTYLQTALRIEEHLKDLLAELGL